MIESSVIAAELAAVGIGPGERWRHRSGGSYSVVCVAMDENTIRPVVVYRGEETGLTWTRPVPNFRERFVRIAEG